jgi:hypothetical protein
MRKRWSVRSAVCRTQPDIFSVPQYTITFMHPLASIHPSERASEQSGVLRKARSVGSAHSAEYTNLTIA